MWSDKRNDKQVFEMIFKRNYQRLCIIAFQIVKDTEEAKDIVNDVFEYAWRNFEGLNKVTIDAYLFTSVKNKCLNQLEWNKKKEAFSESDLDLLASLEEPSGNEQDELIEQVYLICKHLPEKTRYILNQCYFHRRKYKEVAEELGITSDAVKKHIMKALRTLRESVKKREDK